MSSTWIFQANPAQFRIDDFLATSPETCLWRVSRGRSKIRIGDKVYLWRSISGGDRAYAGIIAEAVIVGPVAEQRDDTSSRPFWLKAIDADTIMDRVAIHFTRFGSEDERIAFDEMKVDPVLANMQIMKVSAGTNFPLQNEYASRLASIWSKNGQRWERKDIITALLSYVRHDKPEQLALTVGRTVSDARKKLVSLQNFDPMSAHACGKLVCSLERDVWDEFFDTSAMKLRETDLVKVLKT